MKRPGDLIRAFAARLVTDTTLARVIDPTVADLQFEHARATASGRWWSARWIHAKGLFALVNVIGRQIVREFTDNWSTGESRAIGRVVAISSTTAGIATLLVVGGALYRARWEFPWSAALFLVPQAGPIVLPIGLLLGVLLSYRATGISRRAGAAILGLTMLVSGSSFVLSGWIIPTANQAFRVAVVSHMVPSRNLVREPIRRGTPELSLGELRHELSQPEVPRRSGRGQLLSQYYLRFALPFASVAVTILALCILTRRRLRWWQALGVWMGITCGYYACLIIGLDSNLLPPFVGSWLANVVCLATALVVLRRTPRTISA